MAEFAGLESDHAEVDPKYVLAAITERYIAEFRSFLSGRKKISLEMKGTRPHRMPKGMESRSIQMLIKKYR